jgi:hypothetical protein
MSPPAATHYTKNMASLGHGSSSSFTNVRIGTLIVGFSEGNLKLKYGFDISNIK